MPCRNLASRVFLYRSRIMYYIIYSSEVVIYNEKHEKVISVPTEKEAIEYIREQEGRN